MAKKKGKQPVAEELAEASGGKTSPKPQPVSSTTTRSPPPIPMSPTLLIGRNKHWRYISAYHGHWLQMPAEVLETVAQINYNMPRPRPIDIATLFDLVKLRRHVDDATNLAIRAASDIASPTLTNVHGGFHDTSNMNSLGSLGFGSGGHAGKLSRERKFRMREQASQKLARAYRLDEIACSVATMQGASTLDELGSLVLHRNPEDPDANYVHFFHEKIPSRQLAEFTSVQPLTNIIENHSGEAEVLRTRATVKAFQDDYEGAVRDLTKALSICRWRHPSHSPEHEELQALESSRARRRQEQVVLAEKDQPSSLEGQIYFQRASVHLTLAYRCVMGAFLPGVDKLGNPLHGSGGASRGTEDKSGPGTGREDESSQIEARKLVKVYAKRSLRDYMSFLGRFEYSPNFPVRQVKAYTDRVFLASNGVRQPRQTEVIDPNEAAHTVYSLAELFAPMPPPDLPPYPTDDHFKAQQQPIGLDDNYEWVTYHPLLTDALHCLLLAHCLAQTSSKELQRHAYMVARLNRLADGYPIFQNCRSLARVDWVEVLRSTDNWLDLGASWDMLCNPTPLKLPKGMSPSNDKKFSPHPDVAAQAAHALIHGDSVQDSLEDVNEQLRKEDVRKQAIMDSLNDDRVFNETTFRQAILLRERRAEADRRAGLARLAMRSSKTDAEDVKEGDGASASDTQQSEQEDVPRKARTAVSTSNGHDIRSIVESAFPSSGDDFADAILTDRAAAIGLWVREAPMVTGLTKRKKKPKKAKAAGSTDIADEVGELAIE